VNEIICHILEQRRSETHHFHTQQVEEKDTTIQLLKTQHATSIKQQLSTEFPTLSFPETIVTFSSFQSSMHSNKKFKKIQRYVLSCCCCETIIKFCNSSSWVLPEVRIHRHHLVEPTHQLKPRRMKSFMILFLRLIMKPRYQPCSVGHTEEEKCILLVALIIGPKRYQCRTIAKKRLLLSS